MFAAVLTTVADSQYLATWLAFPKVDTTLHVADMLVAAISTFGVPFVIYCWKKTSGYFSRINASIEHMNLRASNIEEAMDACLGSMATHMHSVGAEQARTRFGARCRQLAEMKPYPDQKINGRFYPEF